MKRATKVPRWLIALTALQMTIAAIVTARAGDVVWTAVFVILGSVYALLWRAYPGLKARYPDEGWL